MQKALILLICLSATQTFAAGSDDSAEPKPTETTTACEEGQIFDESTQACVDSDAQSFNDDQRYDAVRELAYAGAYDRALTVLNTAANPQAPRFLNYQGFIARKQGKMDQAMDFYQAALMADPNLHLARSYMGQGLLADGDYAGAYAQLQEIEARGGKDTWSYISLAQAIQGLSTDY